MGKKGSFFMHNYGAYIINILMKLTSVLIADDECESGRDICPRSSVCVNTNGSYDCMCVNDTRMDETGNCTGIYAWYHNTCTVTILPQNSHNP